MTLQYPAKSSSDLATAPNSIFRAVTRWQAYALIILCIAMAGWAGRDGLINLYGRWMYEEEYDYGFLVAALVPLLLWGRRWRIHALSSPTVWPGLAIVILAQLCALTGELGESYYIEQAALIFTLLGILVTAFGTGPFRIIAPLAVLLLLTLPLPYTLQAMLTIKLQLLSTDIGAGVINLFGIPVFVEGNIVDLGPFKLQVAEACSGLRYLLPLSCIAFLLAFLYKASFWKRAIVVLSAAPLTVLVNSFRIAVTAVLVNSFGIEMAEGFLHWFEGWAIFCLAILLLFLEIIVLEGFSFAKANIEPIFIPRPALISQGVTGKLNGSLIAAFCVCVLALGISGFIDSVHSSVSKPSRDNFEIFPRQIGDWSGHEARLEPSVLETLKATDTYTGDFSKGGSPAVNLFIAYYDSLNKGGAIHSPRVCLPGAGWEFASFEEKNFADMVPGVDGTFNRVIIQKGAEKMLMYYWFQQRERRTADEFNMKYFLLIDSLTKGRKDGALVRFLTPIAAGSEKGEAEADERLHAFVQAVLPKTGDYLPQ